MFFASLQSNTVPRCIMGVVVLLLPFHEEGFWKWGLQYFVSHDAYERHGRKCGWDKEVREKWRSLRLTKELGVLRSPSELCLLRCLLASAGQQGGGDFLPERDRMAGKRNRNPTSFELLRGGSCKGIGGTTYILRHGRLPQALSSSPRHKPGTRPCKNIGARCQLCIGNCRTLFTCLTFGAGTEHQIYTQKVPAPIPSISRQGRDHSCLNLWRVAASLTITDLERQKLD